MKHLRMNSYLLLAMSLLMAGCFEQAPPKGFEGLVTMGKKPM